MSNRLRQPPSGALAGALERLKGARIAFVSESDGPGGMERMLSLLAAELRAAGCECMAFVPAGGEGWLTHELNAADVPVEHYRLDGPYASGAISQLTAGFRRHKVTLAHSHEFTTAVYGAWAAWRAGIGHVFTMHGSEYFSARMRRRVALRGAVELSDGVVAVSRRLADCLTERLWLPPGRVVTIPNGVRPVATTDSTLRRELALSAEDHLVLAIGNLYPVKGHTHLVDALARLQHRHPTLHVAIAGRGNEAGALEAHARQLGVHDRLHLLGLRADIGNLLGGADVFALPSLAEGLPLALLEAMTAGVPIVASDVGDVRVALAGGDAGRVVTPGDSGALAEAIDRLLRRPSAARQLGERAGQRAASEYAASRMAARYAGVYLRLLGSRLPARKRSLSRGAEVSRAAPAGYRDSTSVASPRQAQGVG